MLGVILLRMSKTIRLSEIVLPRYKDAWHCKKRYCVIKGSRGSGKSKQMALRRVFRILSMPQCNYLCVRRYSNTLRDSIYADTIWAIEKLGVEDYFKCTVSPMEITYTPTNQKILFRGLDEGVRVTSITVPKGFLNFVDIDEAYEIREEDFDKLEMSIRGEMPDGYFKQITLMFNPWSAQSWLKRRFWDSPDPDNTFTDSTTYRDNLYLDDSDRSVFEFMRINNPRRFRIEGDGEWGMSEGQIYTNYRIEEFDVNTIRAIPNIKSAFGLDFGFTDPNAFVCSIIDDDKKKIYIFDEWYKTGVTNVVIANAIKEMGYGGQRIMCDCAEPKSIAELQELGIKAEPSRKGKDSVNHGIQTIQNYEIVIRPKCTETIKEISNYCWAKDRDGKPTDKPDHEFSHGMDALRYAVNKVLLPDAFSFD